MMFSHNTNIIYVNILDEIYRNNNNNYIFATKKT